MRYLALLRGINVGGNTLIKMAALKECFESLGFQKVRTYINSGNVIFETDESNTTALARMIEERIEQSFSHSVKVVVFSRDEWRDIIEAAPQQWGSDMERYRYNLLVLLPPTTAQDAIEQCGQPKPDIEFAEAGERVIYQGAQWKAITRTNYAKIVGKPIYKQMTIRNYNTSIKLLSLLEADS